MINTQLPTRLNCVATHTLGFNGHFSGETGLAGCPLNSPPFILGLRILLGQA